MFNHRRNITKFLLSPKGLFGSVAIAALATFALVSFLKPDASPERSSPPAGFPQSKEEAKVHAPPSRVKEALEKKDWEKLKALLADENSSEDSLSQVLRAQDLHQVDATAVPMLADALIDSWPNDPSAKPRVRVLLTRSFSKLNLSTAQQKKLRQKMAKLKKPDQNRFLTESFVATVPYPPGETAYLKKAILNPEPTLAREALYVAERVQDPAARKKLTGDFGSQFFKASPQVRPYIASAMIRDPEKFRKDPRSKKIVDYIRAQKDDVWKDIQASVR